MIVFDEGALADLERILAFNEAFDPDWAAEQLATIRSAIEVLEAHPHIGRPVDRELRELVISIGRTGFVALYQYERLDHLVRILGIRHQREAGYQER